MLDAAAEARADVSALPRIAPFARDVAERDARRARYFAALCEPVGERASVGQLSALQEEIDRRLAMLKADVAKAEEASHAAASRLEREMQTHATEARGPPAAALALASARTIPQPA